MHRIDLDSFITQLAAARDAGNRAECRKLLADYRAQDEGRLIRKEDLTEAPRLVTYPRYRSARDLINEIESINLRDYGISTTGDCERIEAIIAQRIR